MKRRCNRFVWRTCSVIGLAGSCTHAEITADYIQSKPSTEIQPQCIRGRPVLSFFSSLNLSCPVFPSISFLLPSVSLLSLSLFRSCHHPCFVPASILPFHCCLHPSNWISCTCPRFESRKCVPTEAQTDNKQTHGLTELESVNLDSKQWICICHAANSIILSSFSFLSLSVFSEKDTNEVAANGGVTSTKKGVSTRTSSPSTKVTGVSTKLVLLAPRQRPVLRQQPQRVPRLAVSRHQGEGHS